MKVREFIELLQQHDPEIETAIIFEGIIRRLEPANVYRGNATTKDFIANGTALGPVLLIDADEYFDPAEFREEPQE